VKLLVTARGRRNPCLNLTFGTKCATNDAGGCLMHAYVRERDKSNRLPIRTAVRVPCSTANSFGFSSQRVRIKSGLAASRRSQISSLSVQRAQPMMNTSDGREQAPGRGTSRLQPAQRLLQCGSHGLHHSLVFQSMVRLHMNQGRMNGDMTPKQ
jgi:hypothetical protein